MGKAIHEYHVSSVYTANSVKCQEMDLFRVRSIMSEGFALLSCYTALVGSRLLIALRKIPFEESSSPKRRRTLIFSAEKCGKICILNWEYFITA